MYKLKIYCNDIDNDYYEYGCGANESYYKLLVQGYSSALEEVQGLMSIGKDNCWFEMERDFEVTETYATNVLTLGTVFPVAVVCYDKPPHNRENDCNITIITGYDIEKCDE